MASVLHDETAVSDRVPALELRDLTVTFETKAGLARAVDGVSLELAPAEVLGIVGESGSGKTVSMLAVMRLIVEPNASIEGQVLHQGRELTGLNDREIRSVRGGDIAMIFQDPAKALSPFYSIGAQVAEQLRVHEDVSRRQARKRVLELLAEVGIPSPKERIDDYPHQLSRGMQQRVMIAMALSADPSLLIADEPTSALDVTTQADILELFRRLKGEHDTAIVLISHDLGVVSELADRVAVMYAGQVLEEAPTEQLFDDPQHPYTWGLLSAMPRAYEARVERLTVIRGAPPDVLIPRKGCCFAPRCEHWFHLCAERPDLTERVSPGRRDACFLTPAERPPLRAATMRAPEGAVERQG
jgi:oligopeptide/dipeptide ABC transporter ATP-binding protein